MSPVAGEPLPHSLVDTFANIDAVAERRVKDVSDKVLGEWDTKDTTSALAYDANALDIMTELFWDDYGNALLQEEADGVEMDVRVTLDVDIGDVDVGKSMGDKDEMHDGDGIEDDDFNVHGDPLRDNDDPSKSTCLVDI